jgi:hypothetical protein
VPPTGENLIKSIGLQINEAKTVQELRNILMKYTTLRTRIESLQTVSHTEFIDIVGQAADKFFPSQSILHPAIRISHPIKGRIPEAILVIDSSGDIRRIYCPFKVICLVNFPDIIKGQKVSVDAIKLTVEIKEVYIIKSTAYHIAFFMITLE